MKQSYGHDIVGSLLRGASIRVDKSVRKALEEAKEVVYNVDDNPLPLTRFQHVLSSLCTEALRIGVSEEEIRLRLKSQSTGKIFEPREDKPIRYQDPSFRLTWEEFDEQVDKLNEKDLRDALKKEARLRRNAINELAREHGEEEIEAS